jgi:putative N6-adenine-specific DNA methylase
MFFAVTAPGLEAVCARELQALSVAGVSIMTGGVEFPGKRRELYLANLWLRTASRILVRMGQARATDFPELFRKAVRLPWGKFLRPGTRARVRASSRQSRLLHTGRIAETVEAAIDRAMGRSTLLDGPEQRILVRLEGDVAHFSVDSSGDLLHRRGYRQKGAHAPLRETLAAGVLQLLNWDGCTPLFDPMCGSGTLVIEGALIAACRPPGERRHFSFMDWPRYRSGLWTALQTEARGKRRQSSVSIRGSDQDAMAIAASRSNCERAGVAGLIEFRHEELADIAPPGGTGLILCNPPYGGRMGEREDLPALYRDLGRVYRGVFPGWRMAILSPDDALAQFADVHWRRVAALDNGGIPVSLLVTEG